MERASLIWLDDLARDLLYGARLLRRSPGFAAVALATIAVAIGATVTVFSIVDAWLFRPLAFPDAERLVIAFAARPERPREPAVWLPYRLYHGWKDRTRSLSSVSAAFVRDALVTTGEDARTVLGLSVTPEFFRTFGVGPLVGRTLDEAGGTTADVVVLSHGLWQRLYGGAPGVIGSSIRLSGVPHEIVGVMPPDFETRVLDMRFEFWTPFRRDDPSHAPGGIGPVTVIGRLQKSVDLETARSELATIARGIEAEYRPNFNAFVINLSSLQADNTRTVRVTLLTVSAAVAALLLIAAMNVGALTLGRGLERTREAAIRAAIGSGRARLFRQFLAESALIVLVGGVAGVVLATAAVRLFVSWNPIGTLPANAVGIDLRALAAAAATMAVTIALCGLLPAIRLSASDPFDALRSGGNRGPTGSPGHRAQGALLAAQLAACVVVLVATTLLIRTFARLQAEPLGFAADRLYVANVSLPNDEFGSGAARNIYYGRLAERLRGVPGVQAIAAGTSRPLNAGAPVTVNKTADDDPAAPRISAQEVTPEFFATLQIPIVAGRAFDARDGAGAAPAVILNARAAAELFGDPAAAIGRRLRLDSDAWREVVGVVGNVRSTFFNRLEWQLDPIVYKPAAQGFVGVSNPTATSFGFMLHIRTDRTLTFVEVRRAALAISPRAAVTELRAVPELIAEATRQPAFRMTLLAWFAAVSLLLSAIGVYALVSQGVNQRVREMAIRIALGARAADVVREVTARAVAIGAAGLVVGTLAAFALGDVMRGLLYGVTPNDTFSLVAAATLLLAITAAAAMIPARRVTRIDPARALRGE